MNKTTNHGTFDIVIDTLQIIHNEFFFCCFLQNLNERKVKMQGEDWSIGSKKQEIPWKCRSTSENI